MNVHCVHRPIYSKNSRCFIHLMLKFCCWGLLPKPTLGLSLDPAWGLRNLDPQPQKSSFAPVEFLRPPHRISRP